MKETSELKVPAWLRGGFRLTAHVAPTLASAWAMNLFFTPRKVRAPEREKPWMAIGKRFTVKSVHGDIAGWTWGEGPPVLLVHGWAGRAGQMAWLAQAIVDAGGRAIAVDMPAHGESDGRRASLVHFADVLGELARVFGRFEAVVAHSLGAAGTTLALERGTLEAERVVYVAPPAELEIFWSRFREGVGLSPAVWEAMRERSEAWLKARFEDVVPARLARRMRAPLLIVHDRADREIPLQDARALAGAWPGAQLYETDGLGHTRILRDPQVVARVAEFVLPENVRRVA